MMTKLIVWGDWSDVATGVQRSQVPLVYNESKYNILGLVGKANKQTASYVMSLCLQNRSTKKQKNKIFKGKDKTNYMSFIA
jgi:hypothetical protein